MLYLRFFKRLLAVAETLHRWLDLLAGLDRQRRLRVAAYADEIAATLNRAVGALEQLPGHPGDRLAAATAIRELGRISGYIDTIVVTLRHHLDGRKLAGVKRRLELLRPEEMGISIVAGATSRSVRLDHLAAAEGYFRALADGLRA